MHTSATQIPVKLELLVQRGLARAACGGKERGGQFRKCGVNKDSSWKTWHPITGSGTCGNFFCGWSGRQALAARVHQSRERG